MTLQLTSDDVSMLRGEHGDSAAFAMRILAAFSNTLGASALLDVSRAHIDGCLYHGQASLDFVERLVAGGGRVRVPTTLNVGAIDLIHPELIRLTPSEQSPGRRLMKAHEELGCHPSFTCAPYQTQFRPVFGEQIAWGESNAIVFANSVIGARTNRYGDFIDLCCAHDRPRARHGGSTSTSLVSAGCCFACAGSPRRSSRPTRSSLRSGLIVGSASGEQCRSIQGLPAPRSEDQLKALGAAAASSGAVGLFHAVGITPEAPTLEDACGGRDPAQTITIHPEDITRTLQRLATVPDGTPVTAICLGTPHFSDAEWERLIPLLERFTPDRGVPIYVNTGRATLQRLTESGILQRVEGSTLTVVTDTCTYLTPILERLDGVVMTNSGKWAHYAPGNLGVQVAFGELEDCIASAAAGRVVRFTGGRL